MEQEILGRLKPLVDSGAIEPAMFFRVCALMGVPFAAAEKAAPRSAAGSYAEVVNPDVLAFLNDAGMRPMGESEAFDDNYFVKKSGEPFPKFDKAPGA